LYKPAGYSFLLRKTAPQPALLQSSFSLEWSHQQGELCAVIGEKMKQFRRYLIAGLLISLLSTLLSACGPKKTIQIVLEADLPNDIQISSNDMFITREIIKERFAGLGIHNAKVVISGSRQITVDFSVSERTDPVTVAAAIAQTGLLELVDMGSEHPAQGTVIQTDFGSAGAGPTGIVTLTPANEVPPAPASTGTVTAIAATQASPSANEVPSAALTIYHTVMTGSSISSVNVEAGESVGTTGYVIAFTLKSDAATAFADYTGSHVGQTLAIVLDKKVISAPTISSKIDKGSGYIEGNFTIDSANALAIIMRYGALPIPVKVIESKVVSPTQ
jgi:preprotein translocase subunit SecD